MEPLLVGNVVELKSGGPKMTILRFLGDSDHYSLKVADTALRIKGFQDGDVVCQWFENNMLKDGVFAKSSLKKVED
jgi:uncharacterized protein YodC (DUF2158 family)